MVEGLLLAFHLKGSDLEVTAHKILVITIAMSAIIMFEEIGRKSSVLLTIGRSLLVILQGTWFIQIGLILYKRAASTQLAFGLFLESSLNRQLAILY